MTQGGLLQRKRKKHAGSQRQTQLRESFIFFDGRVDYTWVCSRSE